MPKQNLKCPLYLASELQQFDFGATPFSNSRIAEVITPPIIGVAIRCITSAPAWLAGDHMMGSRPERIALTVMIFGRIRCTAPLTASYKSERDRFRPWVTNLLPRLIKVEQHDHARFRI
jgi:hypothetical protein